MRKQPHQGKIPNKSFVGELDKVKRGSAFRVFRQRGSLLGNVVDEMWTAPAGKK